MITGFVAVAIFLILIASLILVYTAVELFYSWKMGYPPVQARAIAAFVLLCFSILLIVFIIGGFKG